MIRTKLAVWLCAGFAILAVGLSRANEPTPGGAPPPSQGVDAVERLKPLTPMAGTWSGTATFDRGPGGKAQVQQEERIQVKLDGAAVLIEGHGKMQQGGEASSVHDALGVIYVDPRSGDVKMLAVTRQNGAVIADVTLGEDGSIGWGFETAMGLVRYKIVLQGDTWTETGEMSRDGGATWRPFLEMNLKRVSD